VSACIVETRTLAQFCAFLRDILYIKLYCVSVTARSQLVSVRCLLCGVILDWVCQSISLSLSLC